MNSWEKVIKAKERQKQMPEARREPRLTRMEDKNLVKDDALDESIFEKNTIDEEREHLANMTRTDLMDAFMDRVSGMSTDEIIDILVRTKGDAL
jgi:hypothetical protein